MSGKQPAQGTQELQVVQASKVEQNGHTPQVKGLNLLDPKRFGADDNGNAEAVLALHGDTIKYSKALGWLEYTGTHWQRVSDAPVKRRIIETFKKRAHIAIEKQSNDMIKASRLTSHNVAACLYMLIPKVSIEDISIFDNEPDLLNCQNGVVNLRTGSITPHLPCQNFTYCSPVAYNDKADTSLWTTFIHDALGDEKIVHYFQRCVGYSLTGSTREEKLFYAYGPPRAGKGTYTEVFLSVLPEPVGKGENFLTFVNLKDAGSQNFELAPLRPARLVVASESNKSQSLNPARIKSLTGGDTIPCEFKYGERFSYRPQFKVWLVSNNEVNGDPDDDALWGRVQVFHFPNSRLGSEDVTLKERLRQPENLEGFLKWAIDGAILYHKEGGLFEPYEVKETTLLHRDNQDYVKMWLNDCCKSGSEGWTSSTDLLTSYQKWRDENGLKGVSARSLISTLKARFKCTEERGKDRAGTRGLRGIALLSSVTSVTSVIKNEKVYIENEYKTFPKTVTEVTEVTKATEIQTPSTGSTGPSTDVQTAKTAKTAFCDTSYTVQEQPTQQEHSHLQDIPRCKHMFCGVGPKRVQPRLNNMLWCDGHKGWVDEHGRPV